GDSIERRRLYAVAADKIWAIGVTSLTDGCYYLVSNNADLLKASKGRSGGILDLTLTPGTTGSISDAVGDFILASASMPFLFPPVTIYEHKFGRHHDPREPRERHRGSDRDQPDPGLKAHRRGLAAARRRLRSRHARIRRQSQARVAPEARPRDRGPRLPMRSEPVL